MQWRIQDPNQKTPTIQQFSFGPEFQFLGNMTASVEYVGNLVRNGRRLRNLNQGRIEGNTVVFPYAQYGYGSAYLEQIVTNGRSNYHALQAKRAAAHVGGPRLHRLLHLGQGALRLPRAPGARPTT